MEGGTGKLAMMTFDAILRVIYFKGLYGRQRKAKVELCLTILIERQKRNKFENKGLEHN
jgi:hypothetical protein